MDSWRPCCAGEGKVMSTARVDLREQLGQVERVSACAEGWGREELESRRPSGGHSREAACERA
eukprot:919910-Pleurochrysis_carterae.AAC.5